MTAAFRLIVAGLGLVGVLLAGAAPRARGQEGHDPFGDPERSPGAVELGVSAAYSPYEVAGTGVDARGRLYGYVRVVEEARLAAAAEVRFGPSLLLSVELARIFRWVEERRDSPGGLRMVRWGQAVYTAGASVGLRVMETTRWDALLSFGVTHPPGVRMELRAGLIRDPVAMAGSLTLTASPKGAPVSISVALSAAFLANEQANLGLWVRHERPARPEPDAPWHGFAPTAIGFRAGYTPDGEGRQEVGVRAGILLQGGQARPSLAVEYRAARP